MYGRNCADDVSADAVLLSRAVGRPVRVQLTREQEHAWEPKGTAQLMDVNGGLVADGSVAGYDFATRYPSNGAPTLALLLTGAIAPAPAYSRWATAPRSRPMTTTHMRVVAHDMPPIVRASWFRGVSALPNTFAHEILHRRTRDRSRRRSDRIPPALSEGPARGRSRQGRGRARRLEPRPVRQEPEAEGDIVRGRGFAYALYVHSKFPGYGAAWSAWIADVAVNKSTGDVSVTRVVAGPGFRPDDQSGRRAPPDPWQRHPVDQPRADGGGFVRPQFGDEPRMGRLPHHHLPRRAQDRRLDAAAAGPAAARRRRIRLGPERRRDRQRHLRRDRRALSRTAVHAGTDLAGIARRAGPAPDALPPPQRSRRPRSTDGKIRSPDGAACLQRAAALCAAVVGIAAAVLPWRAIAPIARPDASVYSAATIARGQQLAALGDCAVCHTAVNGTVNAGGRALETPFGIIYSTNITPDVETGIGAWSYPAFERAMREGIHRDGRHLYPAFPYHAFRQNHRRRPAGALCLSDGAAAGARRDAEPTRSRSRSICGR